MAIPSSDSDGRPLPPSHLHFPASPLRCLREKVNSDVQSVSGRARTGEGPGECGRGSEIWWPLASGVNASPHLSPSPLTSERFPPHIIAAGS